MSRDLLTIADPKELEIPPVGLIEVEDGETGRRAVLDFRSRRSSQKFKDISTRMIQARRAVFSHARVDEIGLRTDQDYVDPIIRFFQARQRRLKWRY